MTERFIDIKVRTGNSESEIKKLDSATIKLANDTEKAKSKLASFEKAQKDLGNTVNKVGIVYDKTGNAIEDLSNDYIKLKLASEKANNALKGQIGAITPVAAGVNKAVAGMGRSAGMAGIQVQQFVGQIQGGQNALVAFSQQSADLGFVLGAPLLGAITGIIASAVGMAIAFSDTGKAVDDFSFSVKDAIESLDELSKAQVSVAIRKTEKRMEGLAKQAEVAGNKVAALNQKLDKGTKTNVRVTKTGRSVITQIKLTAEETTKLNIKQEEARASLDSINQEYKKTSDLLVKLSENKSGYNKKTIEAAKVTKEEAAEERLSNAVRLQSFQNRLSLETEQLQAEVGIRQAVSDGYLTQQEATASAAFIKSSVRKATLFESELATLQLDEETKAALRLQFQDAQANAQAIFEQRLTAIELTESEKRIAQTQKEAREKQSLNNALLSSAVGLGASLIKNSIANNAKSEKEKKRARKKGVIIDTAAGISLAFATMPYVTALPAAIAIGATGIANLATISSASGISTPTGTPLNAPPSPRSNTPAQAPQQTRAIDLRTDGSAFSLAVAQATKSVLQDDESVIVSITEAQEELVRIGG